MSARDSRRPSRPRLTNADRVRARHLRILEAPHRELDRQLDQAVRLDDERDRRPQSRGDTAA